MPSPRDPGDGGYDIATIRMHVRTNDASSPQVSIHSDSGGRPGASRHVLNLPENASTGLNVVDFAGTDVKLDADHNLLADVPGASYGR